MIKISNSAHWLKEQSDLQPTDFAIITGTKTLSYSKLYNESLALYNHLDQIGIKEKDNIGILFGHDYKFFVIANALWMIGAVPVPLNTRNTIREVENQIDHADIKHLIIDDSLFEQYSTLHFTNKIRISDLLISETVPGDNRILNHKFSIHNSALIMFTSGSSGKIKAVVHSFKCLFESVYGIDSFAKLDSNNIWLASLPLYHIGGFMILIRALLSGGTIVFPDSLKHEHIVKAISYFNPTHVSLVSTTMDRMLKDDFPPPTNLQYVFLGGGPVSADLCIRAINKGWRIAKVYGSTETCSMVSALLPENVKQKPESAGIAFSTNKIRIVNTIDRSSKKLEQSIEIGEIEVNAKSLFKEYYKDELTTREVLKNGWFHTGDYGWLDSEGYLYVSSRREDLIITGGENVIALEVENTIKAKSRINDAFVFALSDDVWGQVVCAAIVSEKTSESDIVNFLKENIASYKIPKRFYFVESIPKNEMGKVNRAELMKQLNLS